MAEQPAKQQPEELHPKAQAGDLAADALRAAQQAVAGLNVQATNAPGAHADAVAAALEAAKAAVAQTLAAAEPASATQPSASPIDLPVFQSDSTGGKSGAIDLLADVNLNVKIELGRTRMLVEDVLRLGEGSVVELDKLAGDPVDVYVNDRPVARGEVLVLNDNFCVRINEIISQVSAEGH